MRIFGLDLWALICLGLLNRGARPKATHNAPLIPTGEVSLPRLGKYCIFDLLVVGNGGPIMLVCSNVRVSKVFFYF